MTFRDREKRRLETLKPKLFSERARRSGMYRGARREFCLHEYCSVENLEVGIRDAALTYFETRAIGWHDGKSNGPSNHLCCSQSSCVNVWFPFVQAPEALGAVVRGLGYDVDAMLPIKSDLPLPDGSRPYVAFEWIGERNYLGELRRGEPAPDEGRTRGASFTSLDFCFRFRRSDGRIQIVAGEWKYTEQYRVGADLRFSGSGTDRLDRVYREHLARPDSQIVGDVAPEALFFDPFDQLMRQQLLCTAMERCREMDADVVGAAAYRAPGEQGIDEGASHRMRLRESVQTSIPCGRRSCARVGSRASPPRICSGSCALTRRCCRQGSTWNPATAEWRDRRCPAGRGASGELDHEAELGGVQPDSSHRSFNRIAEFQVVRTFPPMARQPCLRTWCG